MAVTNPDKVVTKQDLADFYNEILPYLGGMPEMVANKFSRSDIYSTTEKMIGQWTDGKPLYQKLFTISIPASTAQGGTVDAVIANYVANVDSIVDVKVLGVINDGSSVISPLPYINSDSATALSYKLWKYKRTRNTPTITITKSVPNSNNITAYVIIQYTKTTDSATSIGVDTDYSTTEKIVGTWIDGKPLYQKTIPITLPTCTTDGTEVSASFAIGASIDKAVYVNAWFDNEGKISHIYTATGSSTKYIRCLVQTNAYATAADRNKIRIGSASKSTNGCTGYATIQYTKTT